MNEKKKVVVAVTGASGALYAALLLKKLDSLTSQLAIYHTVWSTNAKDVWAHELENTDYTKYDAISYDNKSFLAPFASGSSKYDTMIIIPCSMGTLGRIASGVSTDLITRSADVMLKERRKLICVLRETPYNLIHIQNMEKITLAGGVICPASPSFYHKPKDIESCVNVVVDRVLQLAGFDVDTFRWQSEE